MAQQLGCRGVAIRWREGTAKRGASTGFSMYGPEPTEWLNVVRSVAAVEEDGRWEWSAWGLPQSFEDLVAYRRRRVRDRLTPDSIISYCGSLGIRPYEESFYRTAGQLVENLRITGNIRTETLQQTRVWHGLE